MKAPFRTPGPIRASIAAGLIILGAETAVAASSCAIDGAQGPASLLVWRCTGEGWKIVREHNFSNSVDRSEIDRLVRR